VLFSYETVVKRWPIIITGVIDVLHKACHDLSLEIQQLSGSDSEDTEKENQKHEIQKKISEGTAVIEKISKLKYEMARDRPLE